MTTPGPTPETTLEETLAVFTEADRPCTPRTATEVAEALDCTRRTAHRKLETLSERGDLDTKKVGARSRVWWLPGDVHRSADSGEEELERDQFGEFVKAVEDYAIFTLDPDGAVASWNEGAARIKGYSEEAIVGEHFSTFYPEEEVEAGVPERNLEVAAENGQCEDQGWRVREDGSTFWADVVITAIRDEDGSLRGFTKVTRDLTERKQAEEALRRERASLDRILQASPAGIAVFSADGEVVQSNPRATEIIGATREELYEYSSREGAVYDESGDPVPPEERPFARVFETGEPVDDWVGQIERLDGERRWVSVSIAPIEDEVGEVEQVVVAAEDVTELKERERTLGRERDFVERILETVPVAVGVVDRDGEFVRMNERARERRGLEDETAVAGDRSLYDADGNRISPEELPYQRVIRTGEAVEDWEGQIELPDGRAWVSVTAVPLGDDDPPERVLISSNDVTRLKEQARRLERQRDELEAELADVFERVDDAFYALDEEWRFTYVNDRAEEILEHDGAELMGENLWQAFPAAADGPIWDNYHRAMEDQEPVTFEMYSEVLEFWAELAVYPSETGLSVYMRDITERVERERELEQYRRIVETVDDGVYVLDDDSCFLTVNQAHAELTGYPREELAGSHASLVTEDSYVEAVDRQTEELSGHDDPVFTVESELVRPDGQRVAVESRVSLFDLPDGGTGRVGVVRDVTERREREAELARALDLLERTENIADVGGWELDPETMEVYWTEHIFDLLDVPYDEEPPLSEALDVYHPDDRPLVEGAIEEALTTGDQIDVEARYVTLDGEEGWLRIQGVPETVDGEVTMLRGAVQDVTERKERERELEEYERIVETVDDGVYVLDDESRFLRVNDAFASMADFDRNELLGMHASTVFGEGFDDVDEEARRQFAAGETDVVTFEEEIHTAADQAVTVENRFGRFAVEDGWGRVGVVRDITERKERERRLERYQTVFETVEDGIYVLGSDFHFVEVNDAYAELTGYDREELVGSHCSLVVGEDVSGGAADRVRELATAEGESATLVADVATEDGERIPAESKFSALPSEDGFRGSVGVVRDLRDRMEYERELRRYETLIEESTDVNAIVGGDGMLEYVTPSVEYVLGYKAEELVGENAFEYIHPEDREAAAGELAALAEEAGERHTVEFRFRHADGSWVWLETRGRNLRDDPTIDGLVVYTRDVTDRKEYERELEQFETLIEESTDVNAILNTDGIYEYLTPSTAHVLGYEAEELVGENAFEYIHPEDREETMAEFSGMVEDPDYRASAQFRFRHADGSWVWLEARGRNLLDDPEIGGIVAYTREITDRKEYERELESRASQQAVISRLGQHALEYPDVDDLFAEACELVSETLGTDYCKVLDLDRGEGELTLRQGVGWDEGIVGNAAVAADKNSQAGFTLLAEEPVVVSDLDSETRFSGPELLTSHDVTSGVSTIIGSPDDPWGILGIHDTGEKTFDERDVTFVRSVANVLMTAIDRKTYERELERYRQIIETVNDGVYTVDTEGRFTMVNEAYAEMVGYEPRELIGEHVSLVVGDDTAETARQREQMLLSGEDDTGALEAELLTADGGTVPAEATFALLPGRERDYERVGVVRDITERRERERALEESERRYRTLAESFPEGVVALFDEDLRYTAAGGELIDEIGLDAEEAIGSTVWERYPEEIVEEIQPHFEAALDGETRSFEVEYHDRHLRAYTLPVRDADDEVYAGMLVVQDVTDRVERQHELERALDLLEKTERIADVAGWEVDPETEEPFWSNHLFDLVDVDLDEQPTLEEALDVYYTEEDRAIVVDAFEEATETGEPFDVEVRFPRPSGDVGWLRVQGDPEVEDGEVVSLRGAVQDVTERRRREERLEALVDRLEESNERLEQFAYVASHDLQEPLRMVSNYLQLIERRYADVLDSDGEEFIEFAVDGADRMRQMINDLLAYSRVETRAEPFEPTDAEEVVENVLRSLELQIEENDAEVEVGSLPTVSADPNQLEQVFQNLVSNAIKYRDEDPPHVEIDTERVEDAWEFRVADNGIGIDPAHADRIFDVFERLHTSEEYTGTGIGLALCEKIVERHGGDIRVDSEPDEGSTFVFTLPVDPEDEETGGPDMTVPGRETDD